MPRLKDVRTHVRDCCPDCLNAEKTPARANFDGARWTFTPERPSDMTFTITSRSENARDLHTFHPARSALPALQGPGWVEGFFVREVC